MLELKKLTKTYKPRKGVPIQALQDISLSFKDYGLVFILGRSGSGKSTLLNLIGGLDFADDGEIIIDGKSSNDFKVTDYDAYRNQYIGFVFQEYNLLDELTIGENITLALELQNQKAAKQRLDEILKEVDLEEYVYRKPSELSGGQRQRVAIARALIKNPRIIMADEPTGALDEETGIQVLETLKKMSKDKLVIVVSHDREFAEKYADRIIRLKDGKVSSDTAENTPLPTVNEVEDKNQKTKRSHLPYRYALKMGTSGVWSKPFRLIITILLCVVSFAAFGVVDTFNAFDAPKIALQAYVDANYQATAFTAHLRLPSSGELGETNGASQKDIERLKEKTGIKYEGVTYINDKEGTQLWFLNQGRLSGKNKSCYYNSYVYGYYPASKYFFDIMNFILIGNLPQENDEIVITKYLFDQINLGGILLFEDVYLDRYKTVTLLPDTTRTAESIINQELYIEIGRNHYWKIVGVIDTKADKEGKFDSLKPSNTNTYNYGDENLRKECVEYFRYGYHSIGYISQEKYNSIVESHSVDLDSWESFGVPANGKFKILKGDNLDYNTKFWGVASDKDLDKVKDIIWLDGKERTSLNDNEYVIGLNAAVAFVQEMDYIEEMINITHSKTYFNGIVSIGEMSLYDLYHNDRDDYARHIAYFEEAEKIDIQKLNIFKEYVKERIDAFPEGASFLYEYENSAQYVISMLYYSGDGNYIVVDHDKLEFELSKLQEYHWRLMYAGFLAMRFHFGGSFIINGDWNNQVVWEMDSGYEKNLTGGRTGKDIERIDSPAIYITKKLQTMSDLSSIHNISIEYYSEDFADFFAFDNNASFVGVVIPQDNFPNDRDMDTFVFNNVMYDKMKDIEPEEFSFLLAPMPTTRNDLEKVISVHFDEGKRVLKMHNGIVEEFKLIEEPIKKMSFILLYLGIGLAVFSIIMMGNYIGASVSNKKRDIGILRALGAKSSDVFAIFVNESIIIAMINAILSIIVTVFACMGLNVMIKNMTQVGFTVLFFGIRQIAIMVVISIAIAVIASLIPIYKMSRKKPIDCIRNR